MEKKIQEKDMTEYCGLFNMTGDLGGNYHGSHFLKNI